MTAATYVTPPTGADVATFLGGGDDATLVALAGEHVVIITALARSYCRGEGFDSTGQCADDIAAVITAATARLVANPEQLAGQIGGTGYQGGFAGWSLAETFVLNRYRKRVTG